VDSFFGTIAKHLAPMVVLLILFFLRGTVGGRVELRGFGSFELREYAPPIVRSPRTGATHKKLDRKRLYFRMSIVLLKKLNPNLIPTAIPKTAPRRSG
jgi:nucleoid DNA-binding protein